MYQYKGFDDTIAAIITPAGSGGVGIVRLSGKGAVAMLERIFVGKTAALPSAWKTFTVHYGWIKDPAGVVVDEVLVSLMRGPRSYTCEDVAEISAHGGPACVRAVLALCLQSGARLAEPGEFTKRAFLNGRIDLAQAEAVLDVIGAKTEAALKASERQLKGELSTELESLREVLLQGLAAIEANLNFPEDDTQAGQALKLGGDIMAARARIAGLLVSARSGRVLKEGIKVVICGKPNVGKSSLLNALLRAPRAIVTDVAGTTRDVLEELANIDGIPVNLVDTAGILVPRDKVEEEAVRRSRASVESADIVLLVLDQSRSLEAVDHELIAEIKNPHVVCVLNKADLPSMMKVELAWPSVPVSALTRQGLDELKAMMVKIALDGHGFDGHGLVINDMRHVEALRRAEGFLGHAASAVADKCSLEFAAEDIKSAVNELDAITGRNVDADVIDHIFSKFCIGK
jgi:tRNA modification GTPase